jgi:hypothetical protein
LLGHLGGVGLDLMTTIETPQDQAHVGRSGLPSVIGGPL